MNSGEGRVPGEKQLQFSVDSDDHEGMRLDAYIASVIKLCSRSQLDQYAVEAVKNGVPVKLSRKIVPGETYTVRYRKPSEISFEPEKIDFEILYEDEQVIVINKRQGMVVHPAQGNRTGTLVQGLLYHCGQTDLQFDEHNLRPGIVHRLDKDTSGVIIAAKNKQAQEFLSAQFRSRKVKKVYYAVVKGRPPENQGIIDQPLARHRVHRKRFTVTGSGGKHAVTQYRMKQTLGEYSLLALSPETGRTHQLRVHLSWLGNPILGDPVYSRRDGKNPGTGLMLHAYSLKICLPGTAAPQKFTAPIPERFVHFITGHSGADNLSGGEKGL